MLNPFATLCRLRLALAVGALAALAGCASVKDYASSAPENIAVHTTIGETSGRVEAGLNVSRVTVGCKFDWQGLVVLDKPEVRVGVPAGQPTYLNFVFFTHGLFTAPARLDHGVLLTPRPGYTYVAQVSYARGIYDVVIRETRPGSGAGRVVESRPLANCGV